MQFSRFLLNLLVFSTNSVQTLYAILRILNALICLYNIITSILFIGEPS
jgi:hypothetical protein